MTLGNSQEIQIQKILIGYLSKLCDGLTKISGFFSPEITKQA